MIIKLSSEKNIIEITDKIDLNDVGIVKNMNGRTLILNPNYENILSQYEGAVQFVLYNNLNIPDCLYSNLDIKIKQNVNITLGNAEYVRVSGKYRVNNLHITECYNVDIWTATDNATCNQAAVIKFAEVKVVNGTCSTLVCESMPAGNYKCTSLHLHLDNTTTEVNKIDCRDVSIFDMGMSAEFLQKINFEGIVYLHYSGYEGSGLGGVYLPDVKYLIIEDTILSLMPVAPNLVKLTIDDHFTQEYSHQDMFVLNPRKHMNLLVPLLNEDLKIVFRVSNAEITEQSDILPDESINKKSNKLTWTGKNVLAYVGFGRNTKRAI